jgi:hypothetical protein
MSKVTPLPKPFRKQNQQMSSDGADTVFFDAYTEAQLQAYGAAEYQRAIDDASTELEGLRDQTGCSVSDLIRGLK